MGLGSALASATSGLRVAQAGIEVVSQNVANAGSAGYTRRVLQPVQSVSADQTTGVRAGTVDRVLDLAAQKQLRLETAGAAYTSYSASALARVDTLFGTPGGSGSLDTVFNDFTGAMQALASEPGSDAARSAVLGAGGTLASVLGTAAEGVQALRTDAEAKLASDVGRASDILSGIADLNLKVAASGGTSAALLDQRDSLVDELSGLMDIHTASDANGLLTITTGSGFSLVSQCEAVKLTFDGRGELGPAATYSEDPSRRGVGTVTATGPTGLATDLVARGAFRSGEIAAALNLRDTVLPQAQRQLDELSAGLSRALSDTQVTGTPAASGSAKGFDIDLSGLQAGNAIVLDYADAGGAQQRVVLIPTQGGAGAIDSAATSYPGARVKTIDLTGAPGTLAGRIGAALGAGFTVSAGPGSPASVRILNDGSSTAPTLLGLGAGITRTGLTGGVELPFFVDGGFGKAPFTGSFDGSSHLPGLAQRLQVNPALQADPSKLVVYATNPPTQPGDPARPRFLYDALTGAARAFAGSGVGGSGSSLSRTVAEYARGVVDTQGAQAQDAARLDEGQQVALSTARSRFGADASVNIDQEMAKLIELQTAYGANARLISAIKDMLDTLIRI